MKTIRTAASDNDILLQSFVTKGIYNICIDALKFSNKNLQSEASLLLVQFTKKSPIFRKQMSSDIKTLVLLFSQRDDEPENKIHQLKALQNIAQEYGEQLIEGGILVWLSKLLTKDKEVSYQALILLEMLTLTNVSLKRNNNCLQQIASLNNCPILLMLSRDETTCDLSKKILCRLCDHCDDITTKVCDTTDISYWTTADQIDDSMAKIIVWIIDNLSNVHDLKDELLDAKAIPYLTKIVARLSPHKDADADADADADVDTNVDDTDSTVVSESSSVAPDEKDIILTRCTHSINNLMSDCEIPKYQNRLELIRLKPVIVDLVRYSNKTVSFQALQIIQHASNYAWNLAPIMNSGDNNISALLEQLRDEDVIRRQAASRIWCNIFQAQIDEKITKKTNCIFYDLAERLPYEKDCETLSLIVKALSSYVAYRDRCHSVLTIKPDFVNVFVRDLIDLLNQDSINANSNSNTNTTTPWLRDCFNIISHVCDVARNNEELVQSIDIQTLLSYHRHEDTEIRRALTLIATSLLGGDNNDDDSSPCKCNDDFAEKFLLNGGLSLTVYATRYDVDQQIRRLSDSLLSIISRYLLVTLNGDIPTLILGPSECQLVIDCLGGDEMIISHCTQDRLQWILQKYHAFTQGEDKLDILENILIQTELFIGYLVRYLQHSNNVIVEYSVTILESMTAIDNDTFSGLPDILSHVMALLGQSLTIRPNIIRQKASLILLHLCDTESGQSFVRNNINDLIPMTNDSDPAVGINITHVVSHLPCEPQLFVDHNGSLDRVLELLNIIINDENILTWSIEVIEFFLDDQPRSIDRVSQSQQRFVELKDQPDQPNQVRRGCQRILYRLRPQQ